MNEGRAFLEISVPLVVLSAGRNYTGPGFGIEKRSVSSAGTGVVVGIIGVVNLALVDALFVGEVVGLPGRTVSCKGRALKFVLVPSATVIALRLNTGQEDYLIVERPLRGTTTRVVLGVVGLVDLTFVDALFSGKTGILPFGTVQIGRRTLEKGSIPLESVRTGRDQTSSCNWVEHWFLQGATTLIISRVVCVVDLTLVNAFLLVEGVYLPGEAAECHWRTFQQFLVPPCIIRATGLNTNSGERIEDRYLRRTGTCIVVGKVGVVGLTLVDTFLKSGVVALRNSADRASVG